MELYDVIKNRYSVRDYSPAPVEEDKLLRVLDAGRLAPSGNNRQDWKFVAVRDEKVKDALATAAAQPFLATAPVLIAGVSTANDRIMSCDVHAGAVDCSIALGHMTLAAVQEGLGTCWIGSFNQDKCRGILGVPAEGRIIEMLTLGYPSKTGGRTTSRKPLEEVVCWDKFSD